MHFNPTLAKLDLSRGIFPDSDHERMRPLFSGVQSADTLVAALKVAAERFAFDPVTGVAVFTSWRQGMEECTTAPAPEDPLHGTTLCGI